MTPEEGHECDQGAGAPLLWDRLRELGMLSLGKRKLWDSLPVPKVSPQRAEEGGFTRAWGMATERE